MFTIQGGTHRTRRAVFKVHLLLTETQKGGGKTNKNQRLMTRFVLVNSIQTCAGRLTPTCYAGRGSSCKRVSRCELASFSTWWLQLCAIQTLPTHQHVCSLPCG